MDRACSSKGEETHLSPRRLIPARSPSPSLPLLATDPSSSTGPSLFPVGSAQDAPCGSLPARSPRLLPAVTGPSQDFALCASCPVAPLHDDPCAPLPMAPTAIAKPLADVALLEEVLRFQKGTLPPSRSSWGEGPSFSSTPSRVPLSSSLGKGRGGPSLCLKIRGHSLEWEAGVPEVRADVIKGPLFMVLQDGSEVVFPENASSEEDTPPDKELSNFKDFSRFLGMPVEGYEDKIALLLKKLKKMTGGGHSVKKEKRKWCLHRALKGS